MKSFRVAIAIVVQILVSSTLSAATYYVSPLGDNDNSGTSEDQPFQVVQYAIDQMTAGDTLIVLDGFYTGTINLNSGITIKAKNPRKAVFSGLEVLNKSFELYKNGIYKTQERIGISPKQMFFNDIPMTWAQWPNNRWSENWIDNKKWANSTIGSEPGILKSDGFSDIAGLDLTGGYCFIKYGLGNSCYSRRIESFDGTALHWNDVDFYTTSSSGGDGINASPDVFPTLDINSKYHPSKDKFFLAGAFDLLDAPGEWFVKDGYLYLYILDGINPNEALILTKAVDYCINEEETVSDITITGIDFIGTSVRLAATSNDNINFEDVHFKYIGGELLFIDRQQGREIDKPIHIAGSNISFEKCLFAGAQNSALKLTGSDLLLENCVFIENNRHANFESRALYVEPEGDYRINRNTFYNNSSDAIYLKPDLDKMTSLYPEISYNNIFNAGLYNTDCSGVYMPSKSQRYAEAHHNWIHNIHGVAFRVDIAGMELNLHHNLFWASQKGMSIEGYRNFNIYNNTDVYNNSSSVIIKNVLNHSDYTDEGIEDLSFPPIDDWNVLNNLAEKFVDKVASREKELFDAAYEAGEAHPERSANSYISIVDRGSIQGNLIGEHREIFTNEDLSGLNLIPTDSIILDGVEQTDTLTKQSVCCLGSYRGAYDVNGNYWYPGSDWMPYGLEVTQTMSAAEQFAKEYNAVSIVPEINVTDLSKGFLNLEYPSINDTIFSDNAMLAAITWPDYDKQSFPEWESQRQDTLPDFSPGILTYKLTLPPDHEKVPTLVAFTQDPHARVIANRAVNIVGTKEQRTTTFQVISESDIIEETYSVLFEREDLVQPRNAEPFISEQINNRYHHDEYVELYNPNNGMLDIGHYLLLNGTVASNPENAITSYAGSEPNSDGTAYCYVPGYKYNYTDEGQWKDGIVGGILPDSGVNAILAPGDVFVIGDFHPDGGISGYEHLMQDGTTAEIVDINLKEERGGGQGKVLRFELERALFLYKIINDSILNGTKGIWESSDDYQLVDRMQWDRIVMGDTIDGYFFIDDVHNLIRKPWVQQGSLNANDGFHSIADSCEWLYYSRHRDAHNDIMIDKTETGNYLGYHDMYLSTSHLSTVTSTMYKVDPGYVGYLRIRGDISSTSVTNFLGNLDKTDSLQTIVVSSNGVPKDEDAMVAHGDSIVVKSANGVNSTTYVLVSQALNNDVSLTAIDGSGIVVDEFSVSGFDYYTPIAEVLAAVTCHNLSIINVIDLQDNLIPLLTRSFDTTLVESFIETKMYNGLQFEVVAEDGSTALYSLVPFSSASDAYITSNVYTVVPEGNRYIIGMSNGISVSDFLGYLIPSGNAAINIFDKDGNERTSGLLHPDDYVMVTSEDKTASVVYDIIFYEEFPTLSITSVNGSVSINPNREVYNIGDTVTLVATADEGYRFDRWSGDVSDTINPLILVMDADKSITAVFSPETGIREYENVMFEVFPNPSKALITIAASHKTNYVYSVYAISGKQLIENLASGETEFDMSGYARGFYILKIKTDKGAIVRTLILQ
ncbi:MAG: T9SS type A sorting domain-containing protein [Bacteroidales bacterium]|nr:T9SS type A sorting domain-containing protein [Bacteroidales bacterium]